MALLTTEQVARKLGKSVSTINRWAKDGRIVPKVEATGVRGARFYETADVLEILERQS